MKNRKYMRYCWISIKVNFSGGEPFIIDRGNYLGEMVRFCKEDMDMESVTVVTNGSKVIITEFIIWHISLTKWFIKTFRNYTDLDFSPVHFFPCSRLQNHGWRNTDIGSTLWRLAVIHLTKKWTRRLDGKMIA